MPTGVSLEYDTDDIHLLPNTKLMIENFSK